MDKGILYEIIWKINIDLSGAAARTGKFIKKEDKDLYKKESVGVCK